MSRFFKRLSFYLFGLAIGMFILNFFFSKKNIEFDYLPNARTLKSIRNKPHFVYTANAKQTMQQNQIDSTQIYSLLFYGDVNFKKSDLKTEPCKTYFIEPTAKTPKFSLVVERCDSIATLLEIIK